MGNRVRTDGGVKDTWVGWKGSKQALIHKGVEAPGAGLRRPGLPRLGAG